MPVMSIGKCCAVLGLSCSELSVNLRFITIPMLLMDLCLTAGLPWPTILYTVLLDEIMVVTGLNGTLVKSRYKWGMSQLCLRLIPSNLIDRLLYFWVCRDVRRLL